MSKKTENYKQLLRKSRQRTRSSRNPQKSNQNQNQCIVDAMTTGVTTRLQREQQQKTGGRDRATNSASSSSNSSNNSSSITITSATSTSTTSCTSNLLPTTSTTIITSSINSSNALGITSTNTATTTISTIPLLNSSVTTNLSNTTKTASSINTNSIDTTIGNKQTNLLVTDNTYSDTKLSTASTKLNLLKDDNFCKLSNNNNKLDITSVTASNLSSGPGTITNTNIVQHTPPNGINSDIINIATTISPTSSLRSSPHLTYTNIINSTSTTLATTTVGGSFDNSQQSMLKNAADNNIVKTTNALSPICSPSIKSDIKIKEEKFFLVQPIVSSNSDAMLSSSTFSTVNIDSKPTMVDLIKEEPKDEFEPR